MKERHSVFPILSNMETPIADVGRWANALRDLGCSPNHINPDGLWVIGCAMTELAERLDREWNAAFTAAAGGNP